jgi:hypothetical protein
MRAHGRKYDMGKRFTLLIGLAAAGVMALGAQTGTAASEGVVEYNTRLTIFKDWADLHGEVRSNRKCRVGREVIVFRKRPGPDRKLGATRSGSERVGVHNWWVRVKGLKKQGPGRPDLGRVYAKATPKVGDGFVCRGDYSWVLSD